LASKHAEGVGRADSFSVSDPTGSATRAGACTKVVQHGDCYRASLASHTDVVYTYIYIYIYLHIYIYICIYFSVLCNDDCYRASLALHTDAASLCHTATEHVSVCVSATMEFCYRANYAPVSHVS